MLQVFYANDFDYKHTVKRFDEFYRDYVGDARELAALKSTLKPAADTADLEEEIRSLENAIAVGNSKITGLASEQGRLEEERKHFNLRLYYSSRKI